MRKLILGNTLLNVLSQSILDGRSVILKQVLVIMLIMFSLVLLSMDTIVVGTAKIIILPFKSGYRKQIKSAEALS